MHVFRASFDWKRVPLTRPRTRKTRLATSSPSCWQELAPPTHQSPLDEPTTALTPDPARGLVRPVASRAGSCIPANPGVGPGHRRLPVSTPAALSVGTAVTWDNTITGDPVGAADSTGATCLPQPAARPHTIFQLLSTARRIASRSRSAAQHIALNRAARPTLPASRRSPSPNRPRLCA